MSIKKIRERRQQAIAQIREQVELTTLGATNRSCGECQACCHVIAVHLDTKLGEQEDKPNYTTCKHQCDKGCAIYSSRPGECKEYQCMWQVGYLTNEEFRPDKLGVILDCRDATGEQTGKTVTTLVFWEVWPKALEQKEVQRLITWIKRNTDFRIAVNYYGEHVGTKPGDTIRRNLL